MKFLKLYETFNKLNEGAKLKIGDLNHLLRHTDGSDESGSKMDKSMLDKVIEIIKKRGLEDKYDTSEYINDPAKYMQIKPGGVVGNNALFADESGEVKKVWDAEFDSVKDMKEGDKKPSELNPKLTWEKRERAEFPVLVNRSVKAKETDEITVIVGPEENGEAPVWAVFPGPPAPPISKGTEEFWSTHFFSGD